MSDEKTYDIRVRKFALETAAAALQGAPFTEIVQGAEAFYAFLSGKDAVLDEDAQQLRVNSDLQAKVDALDRVIASAGRPPPLPSSEAFGRISNHDLARADQTPAFGNVCVSSQTTTLPVFTTTCGSNVHEIDPDDMKTRIVRNPKEVA